MKITVELDDFWMQDDSDFETEFRDYVVSSIFNQVWAKIKDNAQEKIAKVVEAKAEEDINTKVSVVVNDLSKELIFLNPYRKGDEPQNLTDFVRDKINTIHDSQIYEKVNKAITVIGDKMSQELRDRYDLAFAAQFVKKLNEQGLLKDGVYDTIKKSEK